MAELQNTNAGGNERLDRNTILRALVLGTNLFLLLVAYYVLKTVREPMLLATGSAELKSYAAAGQAIVLAGLVPLYGTLARRISRRALGLLLTGGFVAGLLAFYAPAIEAVRIAELVSEADAPITAASFFSLGYWFYVFVGIFSVTLVAQMWSLANDLHNTRNGERLFPFIVVGANLGAAFGAKIADWLFSAGVNIPAMLLVCAALVAVHGAINAGVASWGNNAERSTQPLSGAGGFSLLLRDRYLLAIAVLVLLLNLVNTTGEFILSTWVKEQALAAVEAGEAASRGAWIGSFYGRFFFWVNIATVVSQLVLVPILVARAGIRAVILALPLVAAACYGLVAAGVGFAIFRVAKIAENTADYSIMNTGRAMLWLPTSSDAKYKAKQAVDTFVVRFGDVLSALVVYAGLHLLNFEARSFAVVNLVVVCLWIPLALSIARTYERAAAARHDA